MAATLNGHSPHGLASTVSTPRPQLLETARGLLLFVDFVLLMQLQLGDVIPGQASAFLGQVFE